MNKIRIWFSNFRRNNKEKIEKFLKLLLAVGIFVGAVAFIFSHIKNITPEEQNLNVYRPTETVIYGSNIEEEEFKEEDNLIKEFVKYCNNGNIKDAYNLLTDECKEKLYPTIESFEEEYYNIIFLDGSKEYNMQSWVNNGKNNTYRVYFIEDIISTGNYDDTFKFEDYITIVTKNNDKKLNVNGYISTEYINKKDETDEIESEIISKDIYMDYIEYKLSIKNKTENEILLDNLKNIYTLALIGENNAIYKLDTTNLKPIKLMISPGSKKDIILKFEKQYGSNILENYINFSRVIINYDEYKKDENNYDNYKEINIYL